MKLTCTNFLTIFNFSGEMMKLHVMSIRDIKVLAEKPKMSFKSLIDGYKYL